MSDVGGASAGGGRVRVPLSGDLDLMTVPAMRHVVRAAAVAPTVEIELDMGEVGFVDSSGLGAIIDVVRELRRAQVGLVLVNPGPQLVELLHVTGTDRYLEVRSRP